MLELIQKTEAQPTRLTLTLGYEQRSKSRLRAALDQGGEAGIFLPRGSTLADGDCLTDGNGQVVKVIAATEPLSEARCDDALQFARACYHLGNRHVPLQVLPQCLRYLEDTVLDDMLRELGLEVERKELPFDPEPGAYHGGHVHHSE